MIDKKDNWYLIRHLWVKDRLKQSPQRLAFIISYSTLHTQLTLTYLSNKQEVLNKQAVQSGMFPSLFTLVQKWKVRLEILIYLDKNQ